MHTAPVLALCLLAPVRVPLQEPAPASMRLVDLDGDGLLDRLRTEPDGTLSIARNRGARTFEPMGGELPAVAVAEVLVADLDHDGSTDLYVVSPGANAALLGDGTGGFRDATVELGLADAGDGRSAELVDVDADGVSDVLLHNAASDVVFWGSIGGVFTRDAASPAVAIHTGPPRAGDGADDERRIPAPAAVARRARTADDCERGPAELFLAGLGERDEVEPRTPAGSSPQPLQAFPSCARTIRDATSGACLRADSTPTLGRLYPLGPEFNVDAAGDCRASGSLVSSDDVIADFGGVSSPSFRFGDDVGDAENTGLASPSIESLALITNASERMRITSSGRVGIGTVQPTSTLHVRATGIGASAVQPSADTGIFVEDTDAVLTLASDNAGSVGSVLSMLEFDGGAFVDQWAIYRTTSGAGEPSALRIGRGPSGNVFTNPTFLRISDLGFVSIYNGLTVGGSSSIENLSVGEFVGSSFGRLSVGASSPQYSAVVGTHTSTTGGHGVTGQTASTSGCGVRSIGDLCVVGGAKAFAQPHPTDSTKEIRFVCLEGNESGTYFRGSARLVSGRAVVAVPEEFRLVTDEAGLTVQLTPVGDDARLWVESKTLDELVVRGEGDVAFDYLVNGVRRGFADLDLVRPNANYVPSERGVPYGTAYPHALRRILVENGTLNPDFTPNEATAARNGWTLRDPIGR